MWNQMRMDPSDLSDVSATAYTYLMNGTPPARNWTALASVPRPCNRCSIISHSTTATQVVKIYLAGPVSQAGRIAFVLVLALFVRAVINRLIKNTGNHAELPLPVHFHMLRHSCCLTPSVRRTS